MALKQKFKSFINDIRESTGKTPEEEVAPSQLVASPAIAKFKEREIRMQQLEHMQEYTNDPQIDREIIDSIQQDYYTNENFDAGERELLKLPEKVELRKIEDDRQQLKKQLTSVSRKVSELVLENHPAYATELTRVMELQQSLQQASVICANGRRNLAMAKDGFTTASLGLLANYRKRQQLIALLKSLRTIKTLQRTDIRLREMLEEEDYPGAIQLCLECQKAASTFKHYHCISELSSKLQDTLEMIEESLDVALSKTCNGFDETHYGKVQTAYKLLGKTQTAMDQLHMHFASAIHNTAFTIVLGYVELCSGNGGTSFQKRQYTDLCKHITPEVFTPCLIDLCKALWEVMKSYHQTIKWHELHEIDQGSESTNEASLNRRYIQQKLEHGLGRIWGDVQQKVKVYLLSTDLSFFKYDEFIQVLDIVNRLILIGEEFCGSNSEGLQDSIRKQSVNYFRNYHRLRMDELRMFLENEGWELCPVKASFTIMMLQEFKFLRKRNENLNHENLSIGSENSDEGKRSKGYFTGKKCPFVIQADEEEHEDVLETNGYADDSGIQRTFSQDSDSDEDIPEELKAEYIDEQTGEIPIKKPIIRSRRKSDKGSGKQAPIVTNTTLNVCRLFGKYIQMMTVLKPIAFDVIICMSQLFDYYLYAIYSFFATDAELNELNQQCLSSKLRTTLKRIKDNLIVEEDQFQTVQKGLTVSGTADDKVPHPHLSPVVSLTGQETLYGLAERVVATESLVFLAEQIDFLKPHLEATIPPAKKAFLQQFYSQTVSVAAELRRPVYRTVAAKTIEYDVLLQMMAAVKYDIRELMSQHSPYVDLLLQDLEQFSTQLDDVCKKVPIPLVVSDVLWEHAIKLANRTIVEGYASTKKCSNEGRALMQLDFQQYLMKLEKLTELRPIPDREFVEAYVKAYYLPEAQLEPWIRDHKEYTSKQLTALINCMAHINKRGRQKLINMIEDIEKARR